MRTSWKKLVQYVGTNYAEDISNELQNKKTVTLNKPEHTPEILARHDTRETGDSNWTDEHPDGSESRTGLIAESSC